MGFLTTSPLVYFRRQAMALGVVLLALVGFIDWQTGPTISVIAFYLLPVALITWSMGRTAGYAACLACALMWAWKNQQSPFGTDPGKLAWNAAVRLATFLVVAYLIDLCSNLAAEVEKLIANRTASLQEELRVRREAEQSIRRLSSQLALAEDEQRRALAQDIHDTLGQNLSLLKMRLQAMESQLPAGEARDGELPAALKLLDQLNAQSRSLVFDLHPTMLDDLGLVPTLRHIARQYASTALIRADVTEVGPPVALPRPVESFVYRATKELVHNAIKHGRAKEALISVYWRPQALRVVVDDDGVGAKDFSSPSNGLGLRWIRERAGDLQGNMQIESSSEGTRVILEIPVSGTAAGPIEESK